MQLSIIAPNAIDPNEYVALDCMTKLISKCITPQRRCVGVSGNTHPIDWISLCKTESILYWPFVDSPSNSLLVELLRVASTLGKSFSSIGYQGYNYDNQWKRIESKQGTARAVDAIHGAVLFSGKASGLITARNRSTDDASTWLSMLASVRFKQPARLIHWNGLTLASEPSESVYRECRLYGWKRQFTLSQSLLSD